MTDLLPSSTLPLVSKFTLASIFIFSGIGFIDSLYLTVVEYSGRQITCSLIAGCQTVLASSYAWVGPVPLAMLGVLFYLGVLISTVAYVDTKRQLFISAVASAAIVGFFASLYFVYLQAVVLQAWCQYCLLSVITSTLLAIIGVRLWRQWLRQE